MNAVLQEKSNSGDDHPAGHDKQKLRRKAHEARRKLKDARKLANRGLSDNEMSEQQIRMMSDLYSGILDKNRDEADEAYEHGLNVKTVTKEQVASIRMTVNRLDEYFGR